MKKRMIAAVALLMISASSYAAFHYWQEAGQSEGRNGETYCQWYCDGIGHGGGHTTVTKGYGGYCQRPF